MSRIKITRDSGYADRVRKYKVICNGDEVAMVGNGESIEFETSSGEKEIYLKIDWCRSNKVTINVPPGGEVRLQGGSSLRGPKVLMAIVYVLFMSHKYLWLRVG
ncbi:MAG TPA: hypothetical protein VIM93_05975 [Kangiella sp.]|uniref:hypothetical protein n=1 Tax=Kangiella sp. TaxID=1920245 RepID=UPI002F94F2FB